jgi:choline dehydrogenase-like flavoprotein
MSFSIFLIVGAGTAGCVLANRLSAHYSVLLLEAGGEPNPLQFVPGLARHLVNHPQVDWMYKTVAQRKSHGFSPFRVSCTLAPECHRKSQGIN